MNSAWLVLSSVLLVIFITRGCPLPVPPAPQPPPLQPTIPIVKATPVIPTPTPIPPQEPTQLPPPVRIGVTTGESVIVVDSDIPFDIRVGGRSLEADPSRFQAVKDRGWSFKATSSQPAKLEYLVVVKEICRENRDEVASLVAEWRGKGFQPETLDGGRVYRLTNGRSLTNAVTWVVVKRCSDEKQAKTLVNNLQDQNFTAWVRPATVTRSEGTIEVYDPSGKALGIGRAPIQIVSREREGINNPVGMRVRNVKHGLWQVTRDTCTYRGNLEISIDPTGKLEAINILDLEEYLKGVVESEMPASSPLEALKAQAICARSESLAKLGVIKHPVDDFDLCATEDCQVYCGISRETERTNAAVDATRGQVLLVENRFVDAVYAANCGGHTENNEDVWWSPPKGHLRGVADFDTTKVRFASPINGKELEKWLATSPATYCNSIAGNQSKNFRWKITKRASELNQSVAKYLSNQNLPAVGSVIQLVPLERGTSGRVKILRVVGTKGSATIRKELPIRTALGALPSSMFVVKTDGKKVPSAFTFQGGGWGHGVGMCQAGAAGMANSKYNCQAILLHYFSGAEIAAIS